MQRVPGLVVTTAVMKTTKTAVEVTVCLICQFLFEPPQGKTNNVVSEQIRHNSCCTVTEAG